MSLQANLIFLPIPLFSFVGGSRAAVDIFVRLGDNHFVKVLNSGTNFDLNQMRRYENKDISHLFVRKQDYKKFVDQALKINDVVVGTSTVNVRQKMAALLRSAEHVFTEIGVLGVDQTVYGHALQVNQATLSIIQSNPNILDVLSELSKINLEVVRHSMATSILAGMMVQSLKWNPRAVGQATLGGMLHDIGLCDLPHDLIVKPRAKMIQMEVEIYESHPLRGYMKLKNMEGIQHEVLAIVQDHHELPSGLGYPRKLRDNQIFPLSRAVAFADHLADLVVRSENNPNPKDLKGGIDILFHTKKADFGEIFFEAARRLLAYDSMKNAA
jgi:HD-GYP domain-containing protein (c-di-GMP phosphodiesterase class II)